MKQFFSKPILFTFVLGITLVIVAYIYQLLIPTPALPTVTPLDGSLFVPLNTPITLSFPTPLSASTRRRLTITTDPPLLDNPTWNNAADTLVLNPRQPLAKNTHHTISLQFRGREFTSFSFTTDPYDAADLQYQAKQQSADDLIFGQKVKDSLARRPWLSSLPVRTPTYYIYFDSPTNQFFIYFTAPQTPTLLEQALMSLKEIGVAGSDLKYKTFQDSSTTL